MPPAHEPRRDADRRLQVLLAVAAAVLALLVVRAEVDRRDERRQVLARIGDAGLPAHRAARELERAGRWDEPARMHLETARRLVNRTLESPTDGTAAELPLAHALAARAFADRPAAWRGPALMGLALYLDRSLREDPRVVTEGSLWEAPLARARELAPVAIEPGRFQAIAYLELWPYLQPERRAAARDLLRSAFEDPTTFSRLLLPWLAVAGDRDEALSVIPDRTAAWQRVQVELARSADWDGYLEARRRWRDALEVELQRDLEEAARLLRGGDPYAARNRYLDRIVRTPTERRFVPWVERALEEAPAGPAQPGLADGLGRWLDWALALDRVGTPALSPAAVDRLAAQVADLPAGAAAHAAVAAGRLPEGERLERRAFDPADPAWGGYRVAKARELVRRDRPDEALANLDRLPARWRQLPSALAVRLAAARRAGKRSEAAEVEALLRRHAARPELRWEGTGPRGELVLDGSADTLRLRGVARRATVVELRLDGRLWVARRVRAGATARLDVHPYGDDGVGLRPDPAPSVHLLEVVPLADGAFQPTGVEIRSAER